MTFWFIFGIYSVAVMNISYEPLYQDQKQQLKQQQHRWVGYWDEHGLKIVAILFTIIYTLFLPLAIKSLGVCISKNISKQIDKVWPA